MKKSFAIIAALAAGFLSVSCQKEDENQVIEGQYTEFEISITTPAPTDVVMTKATDEQETRVENLALLFYKYENSTPLVVRVSNLSRIEGQGTSTNYFYKVKISSEDTGTDTPLMSGEWYLYAIANYNRVGFGNINFDEFATLPLSKAKDWYVHRVKPGASDLNMNEAAMLMSGFFGTDGKINLKPKSSAADKTVQTFTDHIHLRRIASKVSFNFATAEGVSFKPATYSIYNYPLLCHALENQGWNKKDGSLDNAMGTFPGTDIPALVNNASQVKDILDMPFDGSTTFYMYENVQRPVQTGCDVYTKRELRDAGDYGHFTYAPQYGTYVVVKGYYDGPISPSNPQKVTGDVTYTIHLGDFSSATGANDNFTIRRNAKYNYNVTINGVNSIYVEATTNSENQPGAEGNLLAQPITTDLEVDAHYVATMVKIPADFIYNSDEGRYYELSIITRTPLSDGVKVNVSRDGVVGDGVSRQDYNWVHFMKPSGPTSMSMYPGTGSSKLTDIYGLISDLRNHRLDGKYAFAYLSGDFYYVETFIDEYVYDDLELSRYVNAPDRELVLQHGADVSADGHSTYINEGAMSLRQKSIKSMYDLSNNDKSYYPFGIESIEETTQNDMYGIDREHVKGASLTNGQMNTVEMITSLSTQWSNFIHTSSLLLRETFNGTLPAGVVYDKNASGTETTTYSGKNLASAARYACIVRNRDENGNGVVDPEEIKWYLPAQDQAYAIIFGHKALGDAYPNTNLNPSAKQIHEGVWYWTSSNGAATMMNPMERTVSFSQNGTVDLYLGGVRIRPKGTASTRCVRTLNKYDADPSPFLSYDEENRIVSVFNLNTECVRGQMTGEYIPHTQLDVTNTFPSAFVIAKDELANPKELFSADEMKTGTMCQDYYYENADKSDLGLWRIPNQEELFAMMRILPKDMLRTPDGSNYKTRPIACKTESYLANPLDGSSYKFKTVFYISYSQTYKMNVQAQGSSHIANENTPYYRIRCVRDSSVSGSGAPVGGLNAASSTAADGGESRF